MDGDAPSTIVPDRRARVGLLIGAVAIAFLVGLVVMAYVLRNPPRLLAPASTPTPGRALTTTATAPATIATPPTSAAATAAIDPTTLATREAALAGQLAALEARAAAVSASATAASGQASRAESMLIAFAARRAIDRGLPLGYLEEQLRARFGGAQPRATLVVLQAARQPVTLEQLRQRLDAMSSDLVTGGDWWSGLRRELGSLVVLHRAGTPSPLPADRLMRARRLVEAGQVDAAQEEVARLPGAGEADAWRAAAQRYVEVHRALDVLENAAVLGQTAPAN